MSALCGTAGFIRAGEAWGTTKLAALQRRWWRWGRWSASPVERWHLPVSATYRETGPTQPGFSLRLGGCLKLTRVEQGEVEPCFPDYISVSGCGVRLLPYMPTYNYRRADRNHIRSLRSGLFHTHLLEFLWPRCIRPPQREDFPSHSHQKVCVWLILNFSEVDVV